MVLNTRLVTLLMIIVIGSTVISQCSMNTSKVYASGGSPYDSGYDHGCDDAGRSEPDKYINQPEKGPSFHTNAFMDGYYAGLNACSGGGDNGSGGFEESRPFDEAPDAGGERYHDGWNWREICSDLDSFISEPCGQLVTPDGFALTAEGKAVLDRIVCIGGSFVTSYLSQNAAGLLGAISC